MSISYSEWNFRANCLNCPSSRLVELMKISGLGMED